MHQARVEWWRQTGRRGGGGGGARCWCRGAFVAGEHVEDVGERRGWWSEVRREEGRRQGGVGECWSGRVRRVMPVNAEWRLLIRLGWLGHAIVQRLASRSCSAFDAFACLALCVDSCPGECLRWSKRCTSQSLSLRRRPLVCDRRPPLPRNLPNSAHPTSSMSASSVSTCAHGRRYEQRSRITCAAWSDAAITSTRGGSSSSMRWFPTPRKSGLAGAERGRQGLLQRRLSRLSSCRAPSSLRIYAEESHGSKQRYVSHGN